MLEWVLLGLSAGGIGAAGAISVRWGVKPVDALAFLGAIVGAAVTVLGAAALSAISDKSQSSRERSLIRGDYQTIQRQAEDLLKVDFAGAPWPDDAQRSLADLDSMIIEIFTINNEALSHSKHLTFHQRASIRHGEVFIGRFHAFYSDVFGSEEGMGFDDDRTWQGVLLDVAEGCSLVINELRRANR